MKVGSSDNLLLRFWLSFIQNTIQLRTLPITVIALAGSVVWSLFSILAGSMCTCLPLLNYITDTEGEATK